MKTRLLPALALCMTLVAGAACGDDDDEGTADSAATTTDAGDGDGGDDTSAPTSPPGDCALTEPLKIGYAADLGDFGGPADKPGSAAAKVQVDLINDDGGVGGQQVEYVVKDIGVDPAVTQRVAQELLDEGVDALIGPPFAYNGTPLLDTVNGQVPVIYQSSTDPQLADPSRGGFLASFSDPVQAAAAAEFAVAQGKGAAVTFSSPDDVYFSGNATYFAEAFTNAGGELLQDFSFSLADEDFSTQVNQIAALDPAPDVLFTAMIMPQIGTLLQQLEAADLGELTVIGADSFDATVVWDAGAVADGVYFTAHTFPSADNGVQEFLDQAATAGAEIETISFGALASDVVKIIANAVSTTCSLDGPTLIEAINTTENLAVTTGSVTYKGSNGVPIKDVVILTVTDGAPALETTLRPNFIPTP